MKPLFFKGVYKDYIWGGNKLKEKYGKETDINPVAESWELSCHKDGMSVIDGGEYDGVSLKDYLNEHPEALGENNTTGELPILIKLIDAEDNLSVQVHPNDELAKKWEGDNGKTEMWYVIDTEPNAEIVYGVKNDCTEDDLKNAIKSGNLEKLLNSVKSNKGDVFFVKSGTIHAIGKGNLIAEIQQNSNVTYRLYDYNRIGKDGKPRELHIDKGVASSNTKVIKRDAPTENADGTRTLATCEYFTVKEIKLNNDKYCLCADKASYHALTVTEGDILFRNDECEITLKCGRTVFIPANCGEYTISGTGCVLLTSN